MKKKSTLNVSKIIADKIPYLRCYEEHGIIETEHCAFTCAYEICRPLEQIQTPYNIQFVRNCIEEILTDIIPMGMSYQFCVRNRRVDTQDYLKDILVSEHGDVKLDSYVEAYNDTVRDNTSIGHNNFETKIYYVISCSADIVEDNLLEDEKINAYKKVEAEAERLKIYSKFADMLDYATDNYTHFEMFLSAMGRYRAYGDLQEERLKIIHLENDMDMIIKLSYFLDYAVRMKKKNRNVWLFLDGADELLYSTTGSDFAILLLDRTEKLHVPVTFIIDDAVHIFTNQDASIEFDYLINKMNYFKLLGLGPIERKQFTEKLNIADSLIPYITDREPGEGIIITSTQNIPFTDRIEGDEHSLYKLFY